MDRLILTQMSYGMYAITVMDGDRATGCIANTVFQVTSNEPLIAVSLNKSCYTYEVISKTDKFAVNIIDEVIPPITISYLGFSSGRDKNKFESIKYAVSENGNPLVSDGCTGYLECQVKQIIDTSTHYLIISKVVDTHQGTGAKGGKPMTYKYYHENLKGKAPEKAPTHLAEE